MLQSRPREEPPPRADQVAGASDGRKAGKHDLLYTWLNVQKRQRIGKTMAPSKNREIPDARVRDEALALTAAGDDAELAAELYAALLASLPDELAELRGRCAAADWPAVGELAHRVRGASRYCGVPALDQALENLQRLARDGGDGGAIAAAAAQVEAEAQRLP